MKITRLGPALVALILVPILASAPAGVAGERASIVSDYDLLDPITHGDLTIFPVVSAKTNDASGFLTLDEGIRSGEVVITEVGNLHSAMRRRPTQPEYPRDAQVNTLVLVNNSQRPLILLAGEVVTGGKQDRVVARDRIVPAESDPVDLGVFCVEPHRWVEKSHKFDTHASVMAQPSVRKKAMAEADQEQVWAAVDKAKIEMVDGLQATTPRGATETIEVHAATRELNGTSSYGVARENKVIQKRIESITAPMQRSYESLIKQLRNRNAVGVVVAVKGRIVWVDLFASAALLEKYWPKLLESYAAEALTTPGERRETNLGEARKFLGDWRANHETVDSEPGLYRQRELVGETFHAFELTSLLPGASFDVHLSKMAN